MRPERETVLALGGLMVLLALPPLFALLDEPYLVSLATRIVIYGLAAASLDLILGYGAMVSLGHAAFFGLGGYTVAIAVHHVQYGTALWGWWPGSESALLLWPLAVLVAGLAALVIGALSLRTRGVHFIMITLAFAQMLYFLFVSLSAYGGADGVGLWTRNRLPGLDLGDDTQFYYLCLGLLVVFLFLGRRLVASRFGMVIQGVRQNETRLKALGVPTYRYKLAAFTLAGAGAGLAGALIANQQEFVSPELLHWTRSGEILVMVLLGGMGTLFGPVLGAAFLLTLEEVLAIWTEHWALILGPVLVLSVLFARRGLWGLVLGRRQRGDR